MIYYAGDYDLPLFALLIYGKGEQVNPTPEQKRRMTAAVQSLRAAAASRRQA